MSTSTAKLVLASSSNYRRKLLERLQVPFQWEAPEVDETANPGEAPETLVRRLAETKARALAPRFPGSLIIGSDQVAVLDHRIISKPGIAAVAAAQLKAASGRQVLFLTGLSLLNTASGQTETTLVPCTVWMRCLRATEIDDYLRVDEPFDCAGSFKAEALGIALFDRIEGDDPTALIGLPLIALTDMLRRAGFDVLQQARISAQRNCSRDRLPLR